MLNTLNIKKIVYGSFGVFVALYFASAFMAPMDAEVLAKYNITELQMRLLMAGILIPLIGIYFCAAYGFVHFKQYALSIKGSPYGKGINTIANGLGIIALQLLVSGVFSTATSIEAVSNAFGGDRGEIIINSNLQIGFAIAATIMVYIGAGQLLASTNKRSRPRVFTRSFYLLMLLSAAFLLSVVTKYQTGVAPDSIYAYVPPAVAVLFIVVPYIVIWHLAFLAVKRLYHYRDLVKGKVYKQSLGLLTTGFLLIVGSSLFTQLLSVFGEVFADLQIVPLIAIVYVLIGLIGVGYLYIARAATRLRNVEG